MLFIRNYTIYLWLKANGKSVAGLQTQPPNPKTRLALTDIRSEPYTRADGEAVRTFVTNSSNRTIFFYAQMSSWKSPTKNYFKGPYLTSTLIAFPQSPGSAFNFDYRRLVPGSAYFIRMRAFNHGGPLHLTPEYFTRSITLNS